MVKKTFSSKLFLSSLTLGIALSTKTVIVLTIPFIFIYLFSNRISFNVDVDGEDIQPIHFSSGLMREILVANKGIHGSIEISPVGLCRVKFNTSTYSAEYYLVSKEIGE